jgi:hypothetical protein
MCLTEINLGDKLTVSVGAGYSRNTAAFRLVLVICFRREKNVYRSSSPCLLVGY